MHELGIAESVLKIAVAEAERHAAKSVKSIRLILGELSGVDPDALEFSFQFVCRGTIAEGAFLEFERIKGQARCVDCSTKWPFNERSFFCPSCGKAGGEIVEGKDLRVDSLEVE